MDPLSAILSIGSTLIDRFFPDPAAANAAKLQLLQMQQSGELAQIAAQTTADAAEAANSNLFVAGARPFILWVCGIGCAWNWIGLPVAVFLCHVAGHTLDIAPADVSQMMPLMYGMLGLGGLHACENIATTVSGKKIS